MIEKVVRVGDLRAKLTHSTGELVVTHPSSPGQAQRVVIPHPVLLNPEVQPRHQDTCSQHLTGLLLNYSQLTNVPVSRVAQVIFRIETVAVVTE